MQISYSRGTNLAKKVELTVDISKHILVPKQKVLTEKEATLLLDFYNISRSQLPAITIKDPMVKKLNAESNNIIEITRNSEVTGEHKYYRRVTI